MLYYKSEIMIQNLEEQYRDYCEQCQEHHEIPETFDKWFKRIWRDF